MIIAFGWKFPSRVRHVEVREGVNKSFVSFPGVKLGTDRVWPTEKRVWARVRTSSDARTGQEQRPEAPCRRPSGALYPEEGIREIEERKSVVHTREPPPRSISPIYDVYYSARFNTVSDADRFIGANEAVFNPRIDKGSINRTAGEICFSVSRLDREKGSESRSRDSTRRIPSAVNHAPR